VEYAPEERLTHKPDLDTDRTDYSKVTRVYAIAKLANGETQFVVLSRSELEKVRVSAKAKSTDSPWNTLGHTDGPQDRHETTS
jgi:recombination protein RecT